jgi:hypothetical protein
MSDHNQGSTLFNWDVKKEQQKADFMEHLFDVYRPSNNCYTGLWQRFCIVKQATTAVVCILNA